MSTKARMLTLGLMPKFVRETSGKGTAKRPYPKGIHATAWD